MAAGQRLCSMVRTLTISFVLLTLLAPNLGISQLSPSLPLAPGSFVPVQDKRQHEFKLRHIFHHGTHRYPKLHRKLDVAPDATLYEALNSASPLPRLLAQSQTKSIQRLSDRSPSRLNAMLDAGRQQGSPISLPPSAWTIEEIRAPNVTDKETVVTLARAAVNSYVKEPHTLEWEDVEGGFNYTEDFGWEGDGLRGHIFTDAENATIIVSVKGTSTAIFDGDQTTTNDKENDNLFFGCCCGQGSSYWSRQVCDCRTSTYTCNNTCVTQALRQKNRYYYAAQDLYYNVTALYPNSEIWLVGHSLGGATVSLLGATVGRSVVTFEAPGDAMAAFRLGLPTPPKYHLGSTDSPMLHGSMHFGHTGDPLYMGTCGGAWSGCSIAGYTMESICHTGMECIYDTMTDKGWGSHLKNHEIVVVLHDVIEAYNDTAQCEEVQECFDCALWKYYESHNGTSTTTTTTLTSSSYSRTRTQTCMTPGWFGCLDGTTKTSTTTFTSTTTVSTCLSYGWFGGCKDSSTTTMTTTVTSPSAPTALRSTISASTSLPAQTSCQTPGYVWGCRDSSKATPGVELRSPYPTPTAARVNFIDLR